MPSINAKDFPEASFPASYRSDFRVHFDPDVYAQIKKHIEEDTSHEVGGILVGQWQKDENGPYATVTAIIRCDKAVGREGEVTFTHETWNDIAKEMDGPYVDLQIVGWYHSHPGFGVFLSERDLFIQEHFFSNPGQIALVIDPLSGTEGIFLWKKDQITSGELFWVGQKIVMSQEDNVETSRHPKVKLSPRAHAESEPGGSGERELFGGSPLPSGVSWFTLLVVVTLCLGMFVLGGIFSPSNKFDFKQRLLEGALCDYCIATGKRPGLENFLVQIDLNLRQAMDEVEKLTEGEKASDKKGKDAKKSPAPVEPERLAVLADRLLDSKKQLRNIQALYCLSEKEKLAILKLIGLNLQSTIKTKPKPTKQASPKPEPKKKPAKDDAKK